MISLYNIQKSNKTKIYERDFEGMGEGLVLLKVESSNKNIGYNYHLFYRNGKKPPLDIAVNPNDLSIEYVSFFLQDEQVKTNQIIPEIKFREDSLFFAFENLSINNTSLSFHKNFVPLLLDNNLAIIGDDVNGEIYGYLLEKDNYILTDNEYNIVGIYFKNISTQELETLKEVKVI